jgi:tRNA dimethylallyltransferase
LVEEVRSLLDAGVSPDAPAFSSISYRQLLPALRGEMPLSDAIDRIIFDTRRYVRHQQTWLRANKRLVSIDVTEPGWIEQANSLVRHFLTAPDPDQGGSDQEPHRHPPGTL